MLGATTLSCAHGQCDALLAFLGCNSRQSAPIKEDPSVRFPNFYRTVPSRLDPDGGLLELDDLVIQGIQVASAHFFDGPRPLGRPCSENRWAYRYRVVRQGDIVFVKIEGDPRRCGQEYTLDDSGATYAVGADGQILRWRPGAGILDDFEDEPDAGRLVPAEERGAPAEGEAPELPSELLKRDAGTLDTWDIIVVPARPAPVGTSDPDAGTFSPDGGS